MKTLSIKKPTLFFSLPIPELLLLLTAIFWGTSYGVTKDALLYSSVLAFIVIRFGLTSLILLPNFWRDTRKGLTKDWKYAVPTGVILACIFMAEIYGIFHTTASKAAFLISLCILITPILEAICARQWPAKSTLGFALLSLIGVFLLTQNVPIDTLSTQYESAQSESSWITLNVGDYLILLAAFLRACMVVATKHLLNGKRLSSLNTTSIQANVVTVVALIVFLMNEGSFAELLPMNMAFWGSAFYLVIFCTVFALFAQNYAVKQTTPSRVALLTGSEPAFGALFAFYWLGESFTVIQIIGGICILFTTFTSSILKNYNSNSS